MFDGLKDKLASFRDDAAESVEENAEAVEENAEAVEENAEAVEEDAEAVEEAAEGGAADGKRVDTDSTDAAGGTESGATGSNAGGTTGGETTTVSETTAGASDATADADDAETPSDESTGPESAAEMRAGLLGDDRQQPETDDEGDGPGRLKRAAAFATGRIIIEEEDLEEPLWELEMALLDADVEMSVAEGILDGLRERLIGETRAQVDTTQELVTEALHDALVEVISVGQFDFDQRVAQSDKPLTIVFTGVNGVGKTTTIAKLARYFQHHGYSTVLANGDTYRAGANEQLMEHADTLDKKVITHEQGGDPAAVLYDAVEYAEANDVDIVLGDTAGRLHTSSDLMAQLEKIDRVVDPDMTLFVDEAVAGQDAVERAKEFHSSAPFDGAILTKADADPSGGAAISVARVTGKPVLFLGTGQGYEDLDRFEPEALVSDLLGESE